MTTCLRSLAVAAMAAAFTAVLSAAPPVFWTVSTQTDFLKGHADGVSIGVDGRIGLGATIETLADPKEPFVWALTQSGAAWLAGTGNDGKVLKIAPNGTTSVAFDAAELGVHAVIDDGRGGFFAATGPDGRVHHVDAAGKATVAFDPSDRYIWSLARAADGTLYVATGDRGVIYRVKPGGESDVFYRTRTANVISLAIDPQGRVYAGTSTPGRLFRIDRSGRAFVVLDSPHQEVRGLRIGAGGELYAAALTPAGEDAAPDAAVGTVTAQVSGVTVSDAPAQAAPTAPADTRRTGRGAVYVVRGDKADLIWETGTETPYDVLPGADRGALFVATGPGGRIYSLEIGLPGALARASLLARSDARQITQLAMGAGNEVMMAGSNPGRIARLRAAAAGTGTYESEVRDAGSAARWGSIRWRAHSGGRIQIATRTGNTSRPDDTWSDWSAAYQGADGSPITSPAARYLQWRAVLTAGTAPVTLPHLTSVTVAYLPRNLRPSVTSLTVHPPGVVFQKPFSSNDAEIAGFDAGGDQEGPAGDAGSQPITGRRMYRKGLQTIQWRAEDGNSDRLTYAVSYRREGETAWRVLREGLGDPIAVWDTTSVPDGRYTVRVTASDRATNTPPEALDGERDSDGFDVDNAAPVITIAAPSAASPSMLRVTVRDGQSGVQKVEFAIGGDRWQVVYPVDGLSDSREEVFEIRLPAGVDRSRVIIRATDVLQNVSTITSS
ncbi:MAG: hypothetical protein M3R55_07265 [Acidobacteriota bacterium]|nr:hypothetical protein [Acidobacteriota bacterium]